MVILHNILRNFNYICQRNNFTFHHQGQSFPQPNLNVLLFIIVAILIGYVVIAYCGFDLRFAIN